MIPSLAFAAPYEVHSLFAEVAAQLPTPEADEVIEYFERTNIRRTRPGGSYQQLLFLMGIWNYHFDTALGMPRTTNSWERGIAGSTSLWVATIPISGINFSFEEGASTYRSKAGKIHCWLEPD